MGCLSREQIKTISTPPEKFELSNGDYLFVKHAAASDVINLSKLGEDSGKFAVALASLVCVDEAGQLLFNSVDEVEGTLPAVDITKIATLAADKGGLLTAGEFEQKKTG